ncbi:hypothetical protein [Ehrlichia ruminantium]|nr:hypothetical protein [Ehrlichia ruminantium]
MNKTQSNLLLTILFIMLLSTAVIFFQLNQQFNGINFYISFAIITLFISTLFITTLINRIKHIKGITIKNHAKSQALDINLSKQSSIFIPIPTSELSKINPACNIIEYHTEPVDEDITCIEDMSNTMNAHITQNQGLFNTTKSQPLKTISRIDLVIDETTINEIKNNPNASGLLITTNSDISQQIIQDSKKLYKYASLKNKKLLISFTNLKILKNTQKITDYTIEELDTLLQSKVTHDLQDDHELTIYDLVALDILQKCPDTEPNDENQWFNTPEGKIAISFFTMFGKQHTLQYKHLPSSLDVKQAKTKIENIQHHIDNCTTTTCKDNDTFNQYIFENIQSTYLTKSADTNDYTCLYKNRHIYHAYEWIHNLIHAYIRRGTLLKYICTLAVCENYDTNNHNVKTNEFIRKILDKENKVDISEIISSLDTNDIIKRDTNFKNKDLSNLLNILLDENQEACSISELITRARQQITNYCKRYMLCYVEQQQDLIVEVENVSLLAPEKKKVNSTLKNPINSSTNTSTIGWLS